MTVTLTGGDDKKVTGTLLLELARGSILHGLEHDEPLRLRIDDYPRELIRPAATFTTVRDDGELRGCCGTLEAVHPLVSDVARSAFRAAFRDSRFEPVGRHEIDRVRLEVSVLSPLEPMHAGNEAELLLKLRPGTDGLVIAEGARRATFLPKVWESLPDPQQFLAELKKKCGLPADYWSAQLEFLRYGTTTYAEAAGER